MRIVIESNCTRQARTRTKVARVLGIRCLSPDHRHGELRRCRSVHIRRRRVQYLLTSCATTRCITSLECGTKESVEKVENGNEVDCDHSNEGGVAPLSWPLCPRCREDGLKREATSRPSTLAGVDCDSSQQRGGRRAPRLVAMSKIPRRWLKKGGEAVTLAGV